MSDCFRANWRMLGMLGHRHGQDERPTIFQMYSSSGGCPARQTGIGAWRVLDKRLRVGLGFIEPIDYSFTEMSCWH